ncbi:AMP-binding protein [Euzebya tangerina]|uniref:AMP-binding protein n=1 Tax=Euzebya tangerina TaxID=591198 RepID=UPI00196B07CE|nr:AMP-binding protein [Euzebya tangerina]
MAGQTGAADVTPATYPPFEPSTAERELWTLPAVLHEQARTHADAEAIRVPEEGVSLTYAEVLDKATRIAQRLLAVAEPGDRVLIMAPNSLAYLLTWFGAALAGMVEVPLNTAYEGSFLEHQVGTAAPTVAVVDAPFADRFVASRSACQSITTFFVVGEHPNAACSTLADAGWEARPWDSLTTAGVEPAAPTLPDVGPTDLAAIFFTSGTTGPSKGVMMPHAHMWFFADECVHLTQLTDRDVYLASGPLFHGNAQFLACLPALIAGATFVLQRRFSASGWTEWIRDSGATVTNFVGVMMDFVWQQPPAPDDADNRLRCVFAAPTATYVDAFRERFGVEAFVEVFGLTETAMPIMTPYGADRPAGAAGLHVSQWFDIRLVDPETDREVAVGEVGELLVRSREPWTSCLGYYREAERTVEAFRNLWFHTGDGLRRDADGWYYFVDRLKDALRRRGENISSYEVEAPIREHPGVADVAVIAVPADVEAGEDEVMAVVVAEDPSLDAADLWAWCDRRIPDFAVPRYLRFVDALPLTPSEKVRKVVLRDAGVTGDTVDRGARHETAGGVGEAVAGG